MSTTKSPVVIFQERLNKSLTTLRTLRLQKEWQQDLSTRSNEYLVDKITAMMLPEAIRLCAAEKPPTLEELLALRPIGNDHQPGVYAGCILPVKTTPDKRRHRFLYTGSATGMDGGLAHRVAEHASPLYRQRVLAKSNIAHYLILADPKFPREEFFVTLLTTPWLGATTDEINETKIIVSVAETVLISWLGSFCAKTLKSQPGHSTLGPWSSEAFTYTGANVSVPALYQIKKRGDGERLAITYEESLEQAAQYQHDRRKNLSADQAAKETADRAVYRKRVQTPVEKMRKDLKIQGVSEEVISERVKNFQLDKRLERKERLRRVKSAAERAAAEKRRYERWAVANVFDLFAPERDEDIYDGSTLPDAGTLGVDYDFDDPDCPPLWQCGW